MKKKLNLHFHVYSYFIQNVLPQFCSPNNEIDDGTCPKGFCKNEIK